MAAKPGMWMFVTVLGVTAWSLAGALGQEERALDYLSRYGYIDNNNGSLALLTEEELRKQLKKAITDFQDFAGLEPTGIMDSETRELMDTPRCGFKDIEEKSANFKLAGSQWPKKRLSYRVTKYPSSSQLRKNEVDQTVKQAFDMWEEASGLTFSHQISGSHDIDIRFERYDHGDGDGFDGPGGTLAHGFYPRFGGAVHMDDSENWTIYSSKGNNMLQTLTHELGHALGISHSRVRDAVMWFASKRYDPNLALDTDDVEAIQDLYGPSDGGPWAKFDHPPSRPPTNGRSLCSNSRIDAIFRSGSGQTYVFQGDQYWRLTEDGVARGFPKRISNDWAGLPSNLDAAFTQQDTGSTYFFKGDKHWKFNDLTPQSGYPKPISQSFPGIPGNIDAAFVWGGNNKIYFFKDAQYWKFDRQARPQTSDLYPKSIREWDLSSSLEGALQWKNGKTYFFNQGSYWRFNDGNLKIDSATPPFPRITNQWWFGCPSQEPFLQEDDDFSLAL